MSQSPCYNCTDRNAECHSKCERFSAWKSSCESQKAVTKRQKDNDSMMRDYYVRIGKRIGGKKK